MPVASAGASFKLGDASNVLTELGDKVSVITPGVDQQTYTSSVFNPGAALATQYKGYGAVERTYVLAGLWDQTIDNFFTAIQGLVRNFEYCPEGVTTGKVKRTGTVTVGAWLGNGEQSAEGNWLPFSIELSVVTYTVTTV